MIPVRFTSCELDDMLIFEDVTFLEDWGPFKKGEKYNQFCLVFGELKHIEDDCMFDKTYVEAYSESGETKRVYVELKPNELR